jgi:hypothetical protein
MISFFIIFIAKQIIANDADTVGYRVVQNESTRIHQMFQFGNVVVSD